MYELNKGINGNFGYWIMDTGIKWKWYFEELTKPTFKSYSK